MKRKRFSEGQIIAILRGTRTGSDDWGLARKHGISEATLAPRPGRQLHQRQDAQQSPGL